jgi:hypothetical protein
LVAKPKRRMAMDESAMERETETRAINFALVRDRESAIPDIDQIKYLTGVENRDLAAYILYLEERIAMLERSQAGTEQA